MSCRDIAHKLQKQNSLVSGQILFIHAAHYRALIGLVVFSIRQSVSGAFQALHLTACAPPGVNS